MCYLLIVMYLLGVVLMVDYYSFARLAYNTRLSGVEMIVYGLLLPIYSIIVVVYYVFQIVRGILNKEDNNV